MASHGGQDWTGIPSPGSKIRKTTRRLSSNALPSYLQPARLQSTTQEASSSYTQEPSTRHTSLHGPLTLPAGLSQSQPLPLPASTSGSSEDPGSSAGEGSVAAGGSTPTTSRRRLRPRRNVTADAPRDTNEKFIVVLSHNYKIIDHHLASLITTIFEEAPQAVAHTYKLIPDAILQKYWEEFQKRCIWDRSTYSDDIMKKAFLDKLKNRYKGILNNVREAGKRPLWCPNDVWEAWRRKWNSPEFKRKSALAKKARRGKDGVAKGTHTGGSSSHAKTAKKLEKEMGTAVTPDHLFLWTHTHAHDGISFVNDRCKELHTRFEHITKGDQTSEVDEEAVDKTQAFYEASGGINRSGTVFGLGSAAAKYYRDRHPRITTATSPSSPGGGASILVGGDEIHGIRTTLQTIMERLDGFSADKTKFVEHLQRLEERQLRVEQLHSVATPLHSVGTPLRSDANEVGELRERLINLETQIGSSLTQFQTTIDQLQAKVERIEENQLQVKVKRLKNASDSDSSMPSDSDSSYSMS